MSGRPLPFLWERFPWGKFRIAFAVSFLLLQLPDFNPAGGLKKTAIKKLRKRLFQIFDQIFLVF
jgi:hypothetical protein